jgi:hypothetical protein
MLCYIFLLSVLQTAAWHKPITAVQGATDHRSPPFSWLQPEPAAAAIVPSCGTPRNCRHSCGHSEHAPAVYSYCACRGRWQWCWMVVEVMVPHIGSSSAAALSAATLAELC